MDEFKKCQMNHVGIAGMKCRCCNSFRKRKKKMLNRMARSKMKSVKDKLSLEGWEGT